MNIQDVQPRTLCAFALLLSALNSELLARAQGALTPPGPPAPTMKSLDQVEPRTPIPGGASPFTISTPGSYYLLGNLTVAGPTAIFISASDVTVDLNGFLVSSQGLSPVIFVPMPQRNVTIRHGKLSGTPVLTGINATNVTSLVVEALQCDSCAEGVLGGNQMQVNSVSLVNHQGRIGVSGGTGCLIRGVTVGGGQCWTAVSAGDGAVVEDCIVAGLKRTASASFTFGISVGNGSVVRRCTVSNCSVGGNTFSGVVTGYYSSVEDCAISLNLGTDVFRAISISGGCSVRKCVVSGNSGQGIYGSGDKASITDCIAGDNTGDGIVVQNRSYVVNNTANGNGNTGAAGTQGGIHSKGNGNRIEGNHVFGNKCDGILVESDGVKNFVIRNTGGENAGFGYRVPGITGQPPAGANVVGAILLDATDSAANAWANFYQF